MSGVAVVTGASSGIGAALVARLRHDTGFVETDGFPQRGRFGWLDRLVAAPELVADRIVDAVEHDRREIFVPRWYRPAAWAQALAPGVVAGLRRAKHDPSRPSG